MSGRIAIILLLIFPAISRAEDVSILQDLYGYWSFEPTHPDQSKDKIWDFGTMQHSATYQFPANADVGKKLDPVKAPGIHGLCLQLDGKKRPFAMLVPYPPQSPRKLTISLWAQMDEQNDDATLFSNTRMESFGYGQFRFCVHKDGISVIFGEFQPGLDGPGMGPHETISTGVPFPLHQWEHIALVIDEPKARLYLNGVEIGRITLQQPLQIAVIQSVVFGACRGRYDDGTEYDPDWMDTFAPWKGKIDEVAMWTRALSAAEIRGVNAVTLADKPVYDAVPIPLFYENLIFQIVVGTVLAAISALGAHRFFTRQLRRRLTVAESQLMVDTERKRIADDIHDELGARLARLSLLSELAVTDGNRAEQHITGVKKTAQDAARSLDELVWSLKPSHDSLSDISNYLANYASEFLDGTTIALRLEIPQELPDLTVPPKIRRQLMLAWKEAMTNAMKHATASEIVVAIRTAGNQVSLEVRDNGIGMPTEMPRRKKGRNGLRTIHERVERIDGTCTIQPRQGGGTCVCFTIDAISKKHA